MKTMLSGQLFCALTLSLLCFQGCNSGKKGIDAPSFILPAATSRDIVSLYDYRDRPAVVIFMSIDCPYCKQAMPFLNSLPGRYTKDGLAVIGICPDPPEAPYRDFVASYNPSFPLLVDKDREIKKQYGARGFPYLYLLDSRHKIYKVLPGYNPNADAMLYREIDTMLAAGK